MPDNEGALVNDARGRCDVTQQVQVLGRRFTEAAKHLLAQGNDLAPGGDGGRKGNADERDVKDHLLAARHEGHDVFTCGDAGS